MSQLFIAEEDWLENLLDAMLEYTKGMLVGLGAEYQVIEGFPPDDTFTSRRMPFNNPIIHLDIDDISNPPFGFGENIVDSTYDDPASGQLIQIEAQRHIVNFDMGVWVSERAGGGSARSRAYQRLTHIFAGTEAYRQCRDAVGVEIQSFTGGNFIIETINDIQVWRIAGITLTIQCFNRRYRNPDVYIDTINQDSGIRIDDTVIG